MIVQVLSKVRNCL